MIYAFGKYELDTKLYELRDERRPCKLEPRVFDVLRYLIQHRDHVVTREELLEHLWPGQYLSEAILTNCIMAARKALGDSAHRQRIIQTVHGRGYRFIAPVEEQPPALPPNDTPMLPEARLALQPQIQTDTASVFPVTPSPGEQGTFQDVLAGDQAFVTVLCGTLENVEAVTTCVGVEGMQRLRQTFFALAYEEAKGYDGTCKFFGTDGILMLFGLPHAQADHAQRAIRAALGLQCRLRERGAALTALQPESRSPCVWSQAGPRMRTMWVA